MEQCRYFRLFNGVGRCMATKDMEEVWCGGCEDRCTETYLSKKNKTIYNSKIEFEKKLKNRQELEFKTSIAEGCDFTCKYFKKYYGGIEMCTALNNSESKVDCHGICENCLVYNLTEQIRKESNYKNNLKEAYDKFIKQLNIFEA